MISLNDYYNIVTLVDYVDIKIKFFSISSPNQWPTSNRFQFEQRPDDVQTKNTHSRQVFLKPS